MAKLADALDLGSNGEIHAGSTPVAPTTSFRVYRRRTSAGSFLWLGWDLIPALDTVARARRWGLARGAMSAILLPSLQPNKDGASTRVEKTENGIREIELGVWQDLRGAAESREEPIAGCDLGGSHHPRRECGRSAAFL